MRLWRKRPRVKLNLERSLIRSMVLAAVLLVLAQIGLGLARDPVDFYIAMSQKVEAPLIEVQPATTAVQTLKITLKAIPSAPIRVLQNGKVLGTLNKGELVIAAQSGTLQLDGTSYPQSVRVQVIGRDAQLHEPRLNQTFIVEKNVLNLRVSP